MTAENTADAQGAFEPTDPFFTPDTNRSSDGPASDEGSAPDDGPEEHAGEPGPTAGADATLKRRRRGSRGGRRRRGRRGTANGAAGVAEAAPALDALDDDDVLAEPVEDDAQEPAEPVASGTASPAGTRKRRSRRGRRRGEREGGEGRASSDSTAAAPVRRSNGGVPREIDVLPEDEAAEPDSGGDEAPSDGRTEAGGAAKKRRRRGSRGGRRRKEQDGAAAGDDTPADIESIPGEDDDLPAPPRSARAPRAATATEPRRKTKRGRGRAAEAEESDEPAPVPEAARKSLILVNATDSEEQRVAVVEDGQITDFLMTVKGQDTLVNDIYRGRVVNLEPAIGAAFIDFGEGRNGFLHTSDVLSIYGDADFTLDKLLSTKVDPEEWDESSSQPAVGVEVLEGDDEPKGAKKSRRSKSTSRRQSRARPRRPIPELLKKGQMVVVQVTKDAIGDKGPTLTTYISIPGRYLVLMPSMERTGVSRKIEDEKERRRLKRILQSLDVPEGMGVIVRTAGVGHTKAEIKRDLEYLTSLWEAFGKKLRQGHGPAPLYRESDVAIRTMRDLYGPTTRAVIVDDPEVHRHIVEFTEKLMPEDVGRVQLHQGAKPLFQTHGIEADFERIFSRRLELPSGGSIVFDQTEALVAIDVNSGRTRSEGYDFEDIALKANLEAVPEIARQIKLRDLGGILVVDFIDMMKMSNIRAVERAFLKALSTDRARSKLGRISQFGLLEMTRQRLGPGMNKKVFQPCPRCRGTGRLRTVNSRAAAILRRLASGLTNKGFQTAEVRAHPEVVKYLKSECSDHVRALEYRFQREVRFLESPDQHEDSVLRYLRADGREVRPGGRRKR